MKTWPFYQFYGRNLLLMQEYVTIFCCCPSLFFTKCCDIFLHLHLFQGWTEDDNALLPVEYWSGTKVEDEKVVELDLCRMRLRGTFPHEVMESYSTAYLFNCFLSTNQYAELSVAHAPLLHRAST